MPKEWVYEGEKALVLLQPHLTTQKLRTLALKVVVIYRTKKLSLTNPPFTIGGGLFCGETSSINKHAKNADLEGCLVYIKILATFLRTRF